MNGLFAWALQALGFSGAIGGRTAPCFDRRWAKTHMALIVDMPEGAYFCDTGFGRFGLRSPLKLEEDSAPVQQDWDQFRLQRAT